MPAHAIHDPLLRSRLYGFLAWAFGAPDADLAGDLATAWQDIGQEFPVPGDEAVRAAWSRLGAALDGLDPAGLERAYLGCFGYAISKDCPPYETEYGQSHVFQKAHQLADIAGFYRAFGLEPAAHSHDRLDALSVELEFMQFLCMKEVYGAAQGHAADRLAVGREAQAKFLREHLGRWTFGFAQRLAAKASGTVYADLARLLEAHLEAELARYGLAPADVAGPNVLSDAVDVGRCGGCRPNDPGIAAECGG
jgi:DMSO reductase family type II enzyme chaperone